MALSEVEKESIRTEWLDRLSALVDTVEGWARGLGWSTRRIDKQMEDSQVGDYVAPALVFQEDLTRVLLEPIGRSAPGAEGLVDLYLMPAYDDIVRLYFYEGGWHLHREIIRHYMGSMTLESVTEPLTLETFSTVLAELTSHAA